MNSSFKFNPYATNLIILLLSISITIVSCDGNPETSNPVSRHTVILFNDLGKNTTLQAHCRSENKDLGVKEIPFGNSTKWEVEDPPKTVHYCDMSYDNLKGRFDVFIKDRDLVLCDGECRWYARTDGLYIHYSNGEVTKKMYTWLNS